MEIYERHGKETEWLQENTNNAIKNQENNNQIKLEIQQRHWSHKKEIFELKSTMNEMENAIKSINSRVIQTEERICELIV